METGREYLIHGLSDILDAEQQLVEALEQLAGDSGDRDLRRAFEQHREETQGQIGRLEQCFELLQAEAEDTECDGIRGIIAEKQSFSDEEPAEDILNVFNVGAGIKAETYEICEYEALISLARQGKYTKVAQLLNETLKEEKAALKTLQSFRTRLKPETMESAEQEEQEEEEGESRSHRGKHVA